MYLCFSTAATVAHRRRLEVLAARRRWARCRDRTSKPLKASCVCVCVFTVSAANAQRRGRSSAARDPDAVAASRIAERVLGHGGRAGLRQPDAALRPRGLRGKLVPPFIKLTSRCRRRALLAGRDARGLGRGCRRMMTRPRDPWSMVLPARESREPLAMPAFFRELLEPVLGLSGGATAASLRRTCTSRVTAHRRAESHGRDRDRRLAAARAQGVAVLPRKAARGRTSRRPSSLSRRPSSLSAKPTTTPR